MSKSLKTKEDRIELRVTHEDKLLLQKAAKSQGLSLNSYVVNRTLLAAREEAAPYKTYALSPKGVDQLTRLLENPPAANPKLKAAARRFWKAAFEKMAKQGDDVLIDDDGAETEWSREEWKW